MDVVLVVEDCPHIAILEADFLLATGRRPLIAVNGEEALALLECRDVDLILLDLTMPGLSGQEVLDRLNENLCFSRIPVIVVSGSLAELRATPQVGGVFDKPFNLRELETTIDRLLPSAPLATQRRSNRALLG
jgi:CheY-like chemotaxis protein